jgi:hypothetical protein
MNDVTRGLTPAFAGFLLRKMSGNPPGFELTGVAPEKKKSPPPVI